MHKTPAQPDSNLQNCQIQQTTCTDAGNLVPPPAQSPQTASKSFLDCMMWDLKPTAPLPDLRLSQPRFHRIASRGSGLQGAATAQQAPATPALCQPHGEHSTQPSPELVTHSEPPRVPAWMWLGPLVAGHGELLGCSPLHDGLGGKPWGFSSTKERPALLAELWQSHQQIGLLATGQRKVLRWGKALQWARLWCEGQLQNRQVRDSKTTATTLSPNGLCCQPTKARSLLLLFCPAWPAATFLEPRRALSPAISSRAERLAACTAKPMVKPKQQRVVLQVMNPHQGKFHGYCWSYSCSNYCNFLRGWTRCLITQTVGPQDPQVCCHPVLGYNCLILNYVDLKSCQHLILPSESVASLMSKAASLTVNAQATCLLHAESSLSSQAHTGSISVCNLSEWKRMRKSH